MIRKWLCLLLVCMLVFPAVSGLADNPDGETLEYMYSFIPGTVLEGEGTKMIRELLDEVKIRFTRQKTETNDIIRIQLISNGTDAFSLTAGQMGGEEFALMCSLLGSNKLTLKQEQIAPFLHTLVESLGEQGFLKGDNLNKMYSIADRAGVTINNYLAQEPEEAPVAGIDITPYLKTLTENATAVEQREIPPEEQDGSGAVIMTSYLLSEEQRREFVNMGIDKFSKVPVIGDAKELICKMNDCLAGHGASAEHPWCQKAGGWLKRSVERKMKYPGTTAAQLAPQKDGRSNIYAFYDRLSDTLHEGDVIVTSGFGGTYPKGIVVGLVSSLQNDSGGLLKIGLLEPAVDFQKLEDVMVITESREAPPEPIKPPAQTPGTETDPAAQAAAAKAAEENPQ